MSMWHSARTYACVSDTVKLVGEYEPMSEPECDHVPGIVRVCV